jgi:RNA polymerase sigma factor (sigma-70 family)
VRLRVPPATTAHGGQRWGLSGTQRTIDLVPNGRVERNLDIAVSAARELKRRVGHWGEFDEMLGTAQLALVTTDRSVPDDVAEDEYRALAYTRARWDIIDALRRRYRRARTYRRRPDHQPVREVSLNTVTTSGDGEPSELGDLVPAPDDVAQTVELRDQLVELVLLEPDPGQIELSPAEREALVGAARGETIKETAARLFKSSETLKMQRERAVEKLHGRNIAHAVALALLTGVLNAADVAR